MAASTVKVDLRRIGGASFCARGSSNHWVAMDTSRAGGGHGAGSSPMELVLMALAGCTAMDVVAMLDKMRVPLKDLRIEAEAERREECPRVFTNVKLLYRFWGDIRPAQAERVIALSHKSYCSVSAMLQATVPIEHHYEINNDPPAPEGSA